ncbi:MAG: DeoR/GlpR transcriptional regulator [Ruminococcaceae bacterium]|nr:DeoR/GlpR transcriptional regulator [Oscillospiraceae bacterium]
MSAICGVKIDKYANILSFRADMEVKMSISKRQEEILELLNEHSFLTVNRIAELTYTSPSSVRRDLTRLQGLSLIRRTHGGASLFHAMNQAVPLNSRMLQNTAEKRQIAKKAETFLHDGQVVMLDGSSTSGFLVPFIAKHKDMTVFTNNMLTAINAINYGLDTHCIGGFSVNHSAVLSGTQAYRAVAEIHPDIFFFSAKSLNRNGVISDPIPEENYIRTLVLANARFNVFLCDSEKFGTESLYRFATVDQIDACVFDKPWNELKTKCNVML